MKLSRPAVLAAVAAVFAVGACCSLALGTYSISPGRFIEIISGNGTPVENNVFFGIRLPRVLLGLAVGGSLSLAGVLLQAIFRNPLVEPYTIGISGGASFAVCLAVSWGITAALGRFSVYAAGFIGASAVVAILYMLNSRGRIRNINTLLLSGVMISFIFSSLVMLVLAYSKAEDAHGILFWLMGSLGHSDVRISLVTFCCAAASLAFVLIFFHELDALLLGEEQAGYLGIDVPRAQFRFFMVASFLTALSVSLSGIIAFVGLAIPLLARKIIGSSHKFLLPCAFFAGAAFLVLCDLAARTIVDSMELPVGVITGIIGGILFVWTFLKPRSDFKNG